VGGHVWSFERPLVMGVLNATPDSFSDGGEFLDPGKALARGRALAEEGADLIDLGGASSHPLARPVSGEEELGRIAPIVEALLREVALPLSIDTQKPAVAEACLRLGAHLINDMSGLGAPEMARVAARHGVPLVIAHNGFLLGPPPEGEALLPALVAFFRDRIATCESLGARRLILDPGYGFGKSLAQNLALLRGLDALSALGRPLLVCTSRKGSLGRLTGERDPRQRVGATVATSLYAALAGAQMVRVHDVKPFRQALVCWEALVHPEPAR
jgi:dihydropteroate synthase